MLPRETRRHFLNARPPQRPPSGCPDRHPEPPPRRIPSAPAGAAAIEAIVASLKPYEFDRLYGVFPEQAVLADAKAAVGRSADRYLRRRKDLDGAGWSTVYAARERPVSGMIFRRETIGTSPLPAALVTSARRASGYPRIPDRRYNGVVLPAQVDRQRGPGQFRANAKNTFGIRSTGSRADRFPDDCDVVERTGKEHAKK